MKATLTVDLEITAVPETRKGKNGPEVVGRIINVEVVGGDPCTPAQVEMIRAAARRANALNGLEGAS